MDDLLKAKEFYNNLRLIARSCKWRDLESDVDKITSSYENASHNITSSMNYITLEMEIEGYPIYMMIHKNDENDINKLLREMTFGYYKNGLNHNEFISSDELFEELKKV